MLDNGEQSSDGDLGLPGYENGENDAGGTSPKQVAANRRNAMRSTGPRTSEGKQGSRLNALKYGLRAKEVIIPGQENPKEFEAILRELYEDWKPDGHTERHMVEQIALAEWRLRRVRRAELSEIRKRIMDGTPLDLERIANRIPFSAKRAIERLKCAVEEAIGELESTGTVSQETCDRLDRRIGDKAANPARMLRLLRLDEVVNPVPKPVEDNRPPKGMKPENRAAAREHLENCWKTVERLRRKNHQREKLAGEIEIERLSILNGPESERFQRYETAIKRDMYRAIDQLERLQRRRRGEPTLPAVNVNLSHDD